MSILTRLEIKDLAEDPKIKLLGGDYDVKNIEGSSYDLRIGTIIIDEIGRDKSKKRIISEAAENVEMVEVGPSQIITILTLEEVNIPLDLCGTVFAMNSKSSSGFLILNPGHIDPGYKGPISICAINLSSDKIMLRIGDKIFTIIFEKLTQKTEKYKGNKHLSRKDYEEDFYINRADKLSPSVFDFITAREYVPYLKAQIKEVIKDITFKYIGWVVGALTALATIYGAVALLRPSKSEKEYSIIFEENQELKVVNKTLFDSLMYVKEQNKSLTKQNDGENKK
jgi:deoxycytidine triphosphate deaminase